MSFTRLDALLVLADLSDEDLIVGEDMLRERGHPAAAGRVRALRLVEARLRELYESDVAQDLWYHATREALRTGALTRRYSDDRSEVNTFDYPGGDLVSERARIAIHSIGELAKTIFGPPPEPLELAAGDGATKRRHPPRSITKGRTT